MNRLLFLLPVLFMACGTPPKAATEAFQAAAVKEQAAIMPGEEPAVKEQAAKEEAVERPVVKEPDKPVKAEAVPVAAAAQSSGGLENETYEEVFNEVKVFIENLNIIIKNKEFNKWKEALSQERYKEISSREFLTSTSNSTSMRRRGIVLRKPEDYFNFVVVPSRANSQVDKIEILDNNRVRAIYMSTRKTGDNEERFETVPLLVYELAKTGDTWTIIR
jgi:hypothetical protein